MMKNLKNYLINFTQKIVKLLILLMINLTRIKIVNDIKREEMLVWANGNIQLMKLKRILQLMP